MKSIRRYLEGNFAQRKEHRYKQSSDEIRLVYAELYDFLGKGAL